MRALSPTLLKLHKKFKVFPFNKLLFEAPANENLISLLPLVKINAVPKHKTTTLMAFRKISGWSVRHCKHKLNLMLHNLFVYARFVESFRVRTFEVIITVDARSLSRLLRACCGWELCERNFCFDSIRFVDFAGPFLSGTTFLQLLLHPKKRKFKNFFPQHSRRVLMKEAKQHGEDGEISLVWCCFVLDESHPFKFHLKKAIKDSISTERNADWHPEWC